MGMLVPVIGLAQVGSQSMADRYTYLPQIGLSIFVTWGVAQLGAFWRDRLWIRGMASALAVLVLMGLSWRQVSYWQNSEALWRHALDVTKDNYFAHNSLGNTLVKRGAIDEAVTHYRKALEIRSPYSDAQNNLGNALAKLGRIDEAIGHFEEALEIRPNNMIAHFNLGVALSRKGRIDKAVSHYRRALEINPGYAEAYYNIGVALSQKGRIDEAVSYYREALGIKPDYAEVHSNLGVALSEIGQVDEAIVHFRKALEIRPMSAEVCYNLGTALRRQGKMADAIIQWRKALRLQPENVVFLNQLAWVLSTSRDESVRNGAEAVELARRATRLSGEEPAILDTLAAAYAEAGRFPEAVETLRRAVSLASARGDKALAYAVRPRVKLYQKGNPYRETDSQSFQIK